MIRENSESLQGNKELRGILRSCFLSMYLAFFTQATNFPRQLADYCWKVIADWLGQRRVSIVNPGANPLARSVQLSPSVEE